MSIKPNGHTSRSSGDWNIDFLLSRLRATFAERVTASVQLPAIHGDAPPAAHEIVFVDPGVQDLQTILGGLKPGVQVVLLAGAHDALDQIAQVLIGQKDLSAIHIFADGAQGQIDFTGGTVSLGDLATHSADLAAIGSSLAPGGDLMLWSCNTGGGSTGEEFVSALARHTGADVAASTNKTGLAALGGDWTLEVQTGEINTAVPLTDAALRAFDTTLSGPFTVNPTPGDSPNQEGPSIATLPNGDFAVAYNVAHEGPYPDLAQYWAVRLFAPDGTALTGELNDSALSGVSSLDVWNTSQSVVAIDNTHFLVVYNQTGTGPAHTGDGAMYLINAAVVTISGNTLTEGPVTTLVNQENEGGGREGDNGSLSVVSAGNGHFAVVWTHEDVTFPNGNGQQSWTDALTLDANPNTGAITVISGVTQIGHDTTNGIQQRINVTSSGSTVSLLWSQAANTYASYFSVAANGTITGISPTDHTSATLGFATGITKLADGTNLVLYDQSGHLRGEIFDATFSNSPASFQIDTAATFQPQTARATALAGGGFLVVWSQPVSATETDIHARLYDANNQPRTNEFTLEAIVSTDDGEPVVFHNSALGGVVAAWEQFPHASNHSDVRADVITNIGPTSTGLGASITPSILEDTAASGSATITSLVGSAAYFDDQDGTALAGVAVRGNAATAAQGTWEYSTNGGSSWNNISTSVSDNAALILSASTLVRFAPTANWNGAAPALSVRLWDGTGSFSAGTTADIHNSIFLADTSTNATNTLVNPFTSNTDALSLTVTAVNDAPVASGSATLATIPEDTASPTGATVSSLFTGNFSDATDQVPNGSSANTLAGVAITANAEATEGHWQYFHGGVWTNVGTSVSDSNALVIAAADFLRFVPASNYNGPAPSLTVHLIDSSGSVSGGSTVDLTSTGTGGTTQYSSGTVALGETITAVNDAPNLQPDSTTPVSYTENAAATALFAGEAVDSPLGDVDHSANYSGGSIDLQITGGSVTGDRISLGGSTFHISGGNIQDSSNVNIGTISGNGTGHVTISALTSAATPGVVDALLTSFGFESSSDNPGSGDRTVTLIFNDGGNTGSGGGLTDTVTQTVHVAPVNDAPVAAITPASYSATEQTGLSLKASGLSVSDVDGNAGNESVTLSVTEGTLTVAAGTSGVVIDSGNGTDTVTFHGTLAQLNDFLNTNATSTLSYIDNTDTPSASATLTLGIDDGGNSGSGGSLTGSDTATINIAAVNDAPGASMTTDPYAATENIALDIKNTGMSVGDADALGASETVTLSVTEGILSLGAGTSGALVSNNDTPSVTITGTLAQINALLNTDGTSTVSYTETNDNPAASVTLILGIDDGGNTGTGGALQGSDTSTIDITAVNDAPTVTTSVGTTDYIDGNHAASAPLVIDGSLTITDPDNTTFASATVAITSGFDAGHDILAFANDGATMGNIFESGYDSTTGILTLTSTSATATVAEWQNALRSVTFLDSFRYALVGDRTVSFTVNDGTDTSVAATKTVNLTMAREDGFTINENDTAGGSLFDNNGTGADSDPTNPFHVTAVNGSAAAVDSQITLASGALLTVNADGSFAYDTNHAFDGLGDGASGASNTSAIDHFQYTIDGGSTAAVKITVNGVDSDDQLIGTNGTDIIDAGAGNDTVSGKGGDDTLSGGTGNDLLIGGGGADHLNGGIGEDRLLGGDGNDVLNGGAGRDVFNGDGGADTFVFSALSDSAPGATRDVIHDFQHGVDTIDISGFGLTFDGAHDHLTHQAGQLVVHQTGAAHYLVFADADGDGNADFVLAVSSNAALTAGDFSL